MTIVTRTSDKEGRKQLETGMTNSMDEQTITK